MCWMRDACWLGIFLIVLGRATPLYADNPGQEDLDKATESKLAAKSLSDLNEVIRLTESALEKGLDESGKAFAEKLLASTLMQRGAVVATVILKRHPPDPRWPQFRRLALNDLEKAVKLDPTQPQAWIIIAQLNLLPEGDAKRAKEAIKKTVETATDNSTLRARALMLRSSLEKDPEKRLLDLNEALWTTPEDAGILRTRGALLADLKKYEEALADLDKALELEPQHVGTYEAKSIVLAQMKQYDEAHAVIDKACQLAPKAVLPWVQKARIHRMQKQYDAALENLIKAYDLDFGNITILLMRATIHDEKGDKEKALADVDEVLRLRPHHPKAICYKAALLADMDQSDEALALLKELQQRQLQDPITTLQCGMIFTQKKESAKAIELYTAFLNENPDNALILRYRSDAYLNIGKHAEAIADYEKAYLLEPKDSGMLNNFAWVLATSPDEGLRDGKRAVKLATEACNLTDYKLGHIVSTLAAAYAETGDFENALKWARKAVEIGSEGHDEAMKKELESYQADKPWRESLSEDDAPAAETPPPTPETPSPAGEPPAATAETPPSAEEPSTLQPVEPFNGKNLNGWTIKGSKKRNHWTVGMAVMDPDQPETLTVSPAGDRPGELINAKPHGVNIYTAEKFGDCVIELELMVPQGANSGVYVMGEYEIQVLDSYGKQELGPGDMGGIYGAEAPKVNAARPAGEWQNLLIEFQAPRFENDKKVENAKFIKVILNGQVIHEDVEMLRQTRGGLTGHEVAEGPLMFQGNHNPVAYRNIKITPVKK